MVIVFTDNVQNVTANNDESEFKLQTTAHIRLSQYSLAVTW
jgi:hypothetical protein